MADKVFYLTAKSITRTVAEEAFRILREHGMYLNTVAITAKEKLCFLEEISCNPDDCPYARGHFDRVNDAVYEIIHTEQGIGREEILRYAREYRVCPFEFPTFRADILALHFSWFVSVDAVRPMPTRKRIVMFAKQLFPKITHYLFSLSAHQ